MMMPPKHDRPSHYSHYGNEAMRHARTACCMTASTREARNDQAEPQRHRLVGEEAVQDGAHATEWQTRRIHRGDLLEWNFVPAQLIVTLGITKDLIV